MSDPPDNDPGKTLDLPDPYSSSGEAIAPPPGVSAPTSYPDEAAGTMIGPYQLLQLMGKGGMGAVWMADQTEPVKRRVAVKIIKGDLGSKEILARFEAERQALAMMDHPNIAKVLDAGATGSGRPYFVMELVKGIRFTKYCDQEHLTPKERLELFIPVCNAVQHAHQKGIIHRDLKPSNVLIALYDGKPVPKVIDFGIAKATHQKLTERTLFTEVGQIIGTLEYMAPEQAELNNLDIDTRADIYSLGVMLYEILTGGLPFSSKQLRGAAFAEMMRMIREVEPAKPSTKLSSSEELPAIAAKRKLEPKKLTGMVQGDLDWIVMKCLEKDRGRRYETANQLGQELQRFLADEPVQAGPPSAAYRAKKFLRRNKGTATAAGLVVLALVVGIIGTSIGLVMAEQARDNEATQRQRAEDEKKRAEDEKKLAENATKLAKQETQRAEDEKKRAEDEKKLAAIATQLAQKETLRAEDQRKRAEYEKTLADIAKKKAQENENTAEWRLYSSQIASAQREWEADNASLVNRYLNACRFDFRGWEHDYLYTLLNMNQQTFRGHTEYVISVAFSPDGKKIVTGSRDCTLKVWDAASGLETLTLKGHTGGVTGVGFSADGKKIVSGSLDKTLKVWDATSGLDIMTFDGHTGKVNSVAFSPDSTKIVSGSDDTTLKVWDATKGQATLSLKGHTSGVRSVGFSPDGKKIVSNSDDALKVWDASGSQEALTLGGHSAFSCVAFSPDSKKIVSVGWDNMLKVWDAMSGQRILTLTLEGRPRPVTIMAFSPDGAKIVGASNYGNLQVWDATDGRETLTLKDASNWLCVAFSPDGKKIVSGGFKMLKVWDASGGEEASTFRGLGAVFSVAFSPDSKKIVSCSSDKAPKVWDAASGQETLTLKGNTRPVRPVRSVAFSPDGKKIVSGSIDGALKVWDAASGQEILTRNGHKGLVISVAFSPDGKTIVSGSSDKTLKVWNAANGDEIRTLTGHKYPVHSVAFSPDGTKIVSSSFDPLLNAPGDATVKVWDAASGQETLALKGYTSEVWSVAFSPDGKKIVTGGRNFMVTLWDATSGQKTLTLKGHTGMVLSVAFSPNGKTIVSGSIDKTLKVWDATSGQETLTLKGHTAQVNSVAFSPDGKKVVSGSHDMTLKVWDASLSMNPRPHKPPRKLGGRKSKRRKNDRGCPGQCRARRTYEMSTAEPLLKEGMKHREKTMPPAAKMRLTEALEHLVQLDDATGNAAEAERWRKELVTSKVAEKEPKK